MIPLAATGASGANGSKRRERDYYRTAPELVEQFLARWAGYACPETILEPAAGDGAFLEPLRATWPQAFVLAQDVEPQHPDVEPVDFFTQGHPLESVGYDLIITNPPYKHALEFAVNGHALLRPGGHLVLLLRLGFLASAVRRSWFRQHMPERVYVLSERPSFTADGNSDFSEYAWFVWRAGKRRAAARLEIL